MASKAKTNEEYPNGQSHPYHLVDPSPMPILSAFAAMIMMLGLGFTMHEYAFGKFMLAAGVVAVLACMYYWWKDVVRESIKDKAHTFVVRQGLRVGMGLFINSEVMFFVAFFWAFFNASLFPVVPLESVWGMAEGVWPPEGIKTFNAWDLPLLNTLILLLSGTTVTWAHHAILYDDRESAIEALWYTVALGFIFTCLQALEYSHAAFGFTDGVYASTFYMATGFHGFHVIIGTIFLAVCLARLRKGQMDSEKHLGFEFAAWYWHFVDVVWLFLYISIYWWGR